MAGSMCLDDFEKQAVSSLSKPIADYYLGGAQTEQTLRENRTAFDRLTIRPNFLRDVSSTNLSTTLLGHKIGSPICVAPTAAHRLVHPDGEVATARACAAMDTVMTLATISTASIEEVADKSPDSLKWFQTFIYREKSRTLKLVKRAERCRFAALVITIDCPISGNRVSAAKNRFDFPSHLDLPHYDINGIEGNPMSAVTPHFNPTATWDDIKWLKSVTNLPIVLKGILTKEDALLAVKCGVAAVIVSNHGGRQLDGSPATIEALPEVVKVVANRCEVYMDGGIRKGTDVLKALALGARAVFIGRPVLWGLACDGQKGVENVLTILEKELETALRLSGTSDVTQLSDKSVVVSKSQYKSNL